MPCNQLPSLALALALALSCLPCYQFLESLNPPPPLPSPPPPTSLLLFPPRLCPSLLPKMHLHLPMPISSSCRQTLDSQLINASSPSPSPSSPFPRPLRERSLQMMSVGNLQNRKTTMPCDAFRPLRIWRLY
ncbi:hypothetical protein BKA61DRAFT_62383 [Leptodontidium sp. MPI-SDFR-AT-0119]|nr:hypothetical protein BKA61DRAFT_62383 [Leptodontidium sp. MPI-SDFR-AT-0119]